MKYWFDKHRTLYNGNCRNMSELADNSIQCCVTSPPYWGLRKYAGEQDSIWGGTPDCSHEWQSVNGKINGGGFSDKSNLAGFTSPDVKGRQMNGVTNSQTNTCSLCGAWRGAYGLEPSPQMYVQHTVEILREIRRVLRKDGVVFLNINDSYTGSGGPGSQYDNKAPGKGKIFEKFENPNKNKSSTIKAKDLCLIPFRVAITAQVDGWYVRSVIIWSKPNPMPESVTDRPTGSHEYILMLTKSPKYYWDAEAVREPAQEWGTRDRSNFRGGTDDPLLKHHGLENDTNPAGRNLRSVWTFPTQPYREAHFATFPEALPERCIKASTPEVGCCSKCGMAWERIVERKMGEGHETERADLATDGDGANRGKHAEPTQVTTLGWQPGCKCNAGKAPSTVLDPFCGSGTTLQVAAELNRHAVGYEISEEYCRLIVTRNNQSCLL